MSLPLRPLSCCVIILFIYGILNLGILQFRFSDKKFGIDFLYLRYYIHFIRYTSKTNYLYSYYIFALQAGMSLVRFPMVWLEIFIDIVLPALGSTQPLTEMSTSNIF